jgi:hypothetical protein
MKLIKDWYSMSITEINWIENIEDHENLIENLGRTHEPQQKERKNKRSVLT